MNAADASHLTTLNLASKTWYRAVNPAFARVSPRLSHGATRFNPGPSASPPYGVVYFAPDAITALLEVEALLGSVFSVAVPNPFRSSVVLRYQVPSLTVVDLSDRANRHTVQTTLQEMTGDWRTYGPNGRVAPTQALGVALQAMSPTTIQGFLAPSARNPSVSNLVFLP